MSEKPDNPPAFPLGVPHMTEYQPEWGMSLRDWFAGQALAGLAGKLSSGREEAINNLEDDAGWEASLAYRLADAMLAAREPALLDPKS